MASREIFIGSASESKSLAGKVAHELESRGFSPRRWWKDFPAGSYTLDRLRQIAEEVDGAVFIAAGVDTIESRTAESSAPRDNVILEYGLFIGALGRERCFLVADGKTKLPSDALAITTIQLGNDPQGVAEKVADQFADHFTAPRLLEPRETPVVADPRITEIALQEVKVRPNAEPQVLPVEWHQRQLYYGLEGAKNWLRLASSEAYLGSGYPDWARRAASELTKRAQPNTLVSLGPGEARTDKALMQMLRATNDSVKYIPVDICSSLLQRAISEVSRFATVPIGILGDFEERLDFIFRQVFRHGKRPFLYSLLGGTLGNFDDEDERGFLYQMRAMMGPRDSLLIGISIAGHGWNENIDPKIDRLKLDDDFLTFMFTGVARIFGVSLESCLQTYMDHLEVTVRPIECKDGNLHRVIEYWWSQAGRRWLCTRICRYSLDALRSEVGELGFSIANDEIELWPEENLPVRFAMLLLRPTVPT